MNSSEAKAALRRTGGPAGPERGSVLIVGLIMLLVMTIVGVGATQVATLEERMAGNLRDQVLALEAAESALRQAEDSLRSLATSPPHSDFSCNAKPTRPGFYLGSCAWAVNCAGTTNLWDTLECGGNSAWIDDTRTIRTGKLPNVYQEASYVIEEIARISNGGEPGAAATQQPTLIYRITARSTGSSPDTVAIVQSTFLR